jgi:hypothetical protein
MSEVPLYDPRHKPALKSTHSARKCAEIVPSPSFSSDCGALIDGRGRSYPACVGRATHHAIQRPWERPHNLVRMSESAQASS